MRCLSASAFTFLLCLFAIAPCDAKDGVTTENRRADGRTVILMVRHAAKPAQGTGLTPEGQRHAEAYADFFTHYRLGGQTLHADALFAAKDSENSMRSRLTFTPLAAALKLPLDTSHEGKNFAALAARLCSAEFSGKTVLVCWKHGEILQFAEALGVQGGKLPASAHWPAKWPDGEFRWVLQIVLDGSGSINPSLTLCIQNPPLRK